MVEWETIAGIDDTSETSDLNKDIRLNEKQQTAFRLEGAKFLKRYCLEQKSAKIS